MKESDMDDDGTYWRLRDFYCVLLGAASVSPQVRKRLEDLICDEPPGLTDLSELLQCVLRHDREQGWRVVERTWGLTQEESETLLDRILIEVKRINRRRAYGKLIQDLFEAQARGDEPAVRSMTSRLVEVLGG